MHYALFIEFHLKAKHSLQNGLDNQTLKSGLNRFKIKQRLCQHHDKDGERVNGKILNYMQFKQQHKAFSPIRSNNLAS